MQYIRYVVHQTTGQQLPEHEPAGEALTYTGQRLKSLRLQWVSSSPCLVRAAAVLFFIPRSI